MRVFISLLFLTLVLMVEIISAAPETTKKIESSAFELNDEEILATTDLPLPKYRLQTSLFASSGHLIEPDEASTQVAAAFNLRQKRYGTGELDLIVTTQNLVGIFPGVRVRLGEDSVQRAYSKFSTGMYLVPDEGFVNFITIRRLQVRAAVGFDNFLDLDHRLSAEVGVGVSLIGLEAFTQVGWNWFF